MAVKEVRIFVSSPGDVAAERARVDLVVERLNGRLGAGVRLRTILWERDYYTADRTFQAQIDDVAETDLVVCILWKRLGTELDPAYRIREDGTRYESGTVYEFEMARAAQQAKQSPDILVYRKTASVQLSADDEETLRLEMAQWNGLKAFWRRWFESDEGHFTTGFHPFETTDSFEAQLEDHLVKWLRDRGHLGDGEVIWSIAEKGSPFRGLEVFDAAHEQVFFGRGRAIERASEAFHGAATHGTPFLLILGSSGVGKSSFARAGLVPRLMRPGVVPEVDAWREAAFRPGDRQGEPLLALAESLFAADALPGLAEGDFATPQALADLLQTDPEQGVAPVTRALARAADAHRADAELDRPAALRLLLLVDQLEEIFAVDEAPRSAFLAAAEALVATGSVWIAATVRSDAYPEVQRAPELLRLKTAGASFDLPPLGPAEIAEIIRRPAAAAGLGFDTDADGRSLDEVLEREVSGQDALPLLQFTLQHLYEARDEATGRLGFAAYDQLGGLTGAIAQQAETTFGALPKSTQAALPRLLRMLLRYDRATDLVARPTPRDQLVDDPAMARLVEAFVGARLLTVSGDAPVLVRLAHEAIARTWPRATKILSQHRAFLQVRARVAVAATHWRERGEVKDFLLPSGLPLAEASALLEDYGSELSDTLIAFIKASRAHAKRQENRRLRRVQAAAAVLAVLAIGAGFTTWWGFDQADEAERQRADADAQKVVAQEQTKVAEEQRAIADRERAAAEINLALSTETVDGLAVAVTDRLISEFDTPTDELSAFIDLTDRSLARFAETLGSVDATVRYAGFLAAAARAYLDRGLIDKAVVSSEKALAVLRDVPDESAEGGAALDARAGILLAAAAVEHAMGNLAGAEDLVARAAAAVESGGEVARHLQSDIWLLGAAVARDRHEFGLAATNIDLIKSNFSFNGNDLDERNREIIYLQSRILAAQMNSEIFDDQRKGQDITRNALAKINTLLQQRPGDPAALRLHAEALYLKASYDIGDGDLTRAGRTLEDAASEIGQLVEKDPGNLDWRRLQVLIEVGRAQVMGSQKAWFHAEKLLAETLKNAVSLRTDQENWSAAWQAEARVRFERLKLVSGVDDTSARKSALREYTTVAEEIRERFPGNIEALRNAEMLAPYFGADISGGEGKYAEAAEMFGSCVAAAERMLEAAPDSQIIRADMAFCLSQRGAALRALGRFGEARAVVQEAIALRTNHYEKVPQPHVAERLIISKLQLADLLVDLDDLDGADAHYGAVFGELSDATERFGDLAWVAHRESYAHYQHAMLYERRGRLREAIQQLDAAAGRAMRRLSEHVSDEAANTALQAARDALTGLGERLAAGEIALPPEEVALYERLSRMALYKHDRSWLVRQRDQVSNGRRWALAPLTPGVWHQLAGDDRAEALRRIKTAIGTQSIVVDVIHAIRARPVSFYEGTSLLEAEVEREGRHGVLTFLEHAGVLYHLDGSPEQIHTLNAIALLRVDDASQAADYFHLFVGALQARAGRFFLVDEIGDLRFVEPISDELRSRLNQIIRPVEIERGPDGNWETTVILAYDDALFSATLSVERNGTTTMHDDVGLEGDLPILSETFVGGVRFFDLEPIIAAMARNVERVDAALAGRDYAEAARLHDVMTTHGSLLHEEGEMKARAFAALHADKAHNLIRLGRADDAEAASNIALSLAPAPRTQARLAHALMYQGKLDDALDIHRRHARYIVDGKSWRDFVQADFAELRALGRDHPGMAQVEALLAEAAHRPAAAAE